MNVPWKRQRVSATSTIDAGGYFITSYAIPDPEPLEALEELYSIESGAIQALIDSVDKAADPFSIVEMIESRLSRYQMELPMIKLLDINAMRVTNRGNIFDLMSAYKPKNSGEEETAALMKAFGHHEASLMYMSQGRVMPSKMLAQMNTLGLLLAERLNPKHPYTVAKIVRVMMGKLRAQLNVTDLESRLTDPKHDLLLANDLIVQYWNEVVANEKSFFNQKMKQDPYKQMFIYYCLLEMVSRLEALLSMDVTFLDNEVTDPSTGIGNMQAPDRFKSWLQACNKYQQFLAPLFRQIAVPRMLTGKSAVKGYFDMFIGVDWERIQYASSTGSGVKGTDAAPLDLNGFTADVLFPVGIAGTTVTNYRTTRGHSELGIEMLLPLQVKDRELYSQLVDYILTVGNERMYPVDVDKDGVPTNEKMPAKGEPVKIEFRNMASDSRTGTYTDGYLERRLFPVRGSIFAQGLMGMDLPTGITVKILEDQVISSKTPCMLEQDMSEIPYMVQNPPFEVYSPWSILL